jgi:hypothetical protein
MFFLYCVVAFIFWRIVLHVIIPVSLTLGALGIMVLDDWIRRTYRKSVGKAG